MKHAGAWLRGLGLAVVVALLAGRWLAVNTGERLWSQAIGAGAAHAGVRSLGTMLSGLALLTAILWCVGNMHLVYRAIGSVQMKRHIGNLEIDEALPRRYLLIAAWSVGLVVAIAVSRGTDDWWREKALAGITRQVGTSDPILGLDVSYYLFQLPWLRTLHGYATLLAGVVLLLTALLYAAVGAVRRSERRLIVNEFARTHLAGLLAAFAVVLVWGYRLEPAELVAGVHHVPYDGVLADVRIPIAEVLAVLGGIAAAASALWMFVERGTWVAAAWVVLLGGSFLGHYIVPSVVASLGDPEARSPARYAEAARRMEQIAYGLAPRDTVLGVALPPGAEGRPRATRLPRDLASDDAPLWDGFAVTVAANGLSHVAHRRFYDATLDLYPGRAGVAPVFIAAREVDYTADGAPRVTWDDVHLAPAAVSRGAVAVLANRTGPNGAPLFIPDLARPESTSVTPREVTLDDSLVLFGNAPSAGEFLVVGDGLDVIGVPAGGFWRRLALAWILQSPRLLTSPRVSDTSLVLWERDIAGRLAAYAPFARFGAGYPVVAAHRLVWLAPGYVDADAFPLTPSVEWRGQTIQALRAGFVGVVDAATGRTAVYLARDADPLSQAWASLAPSLVRPADSLPPDLATHVRYPAELFTVQAKVLHDKDVGIAEAVTPALERARAEAQHAVTTDPYWWIAPQHGGPELRLRAASERGDPPFVSALLDGIMTGGSGVLRVTRMAQPVEVVAQGKLTQRVVADQPQLSAIAGPPRVMLIDDGIATLQTMYASGGAQDATHFVEVVASWQGGVGTGSTIATALERAAAAARATPVSDSTWNEAQQLFKQLDDARKAGDWAAFGRAYDELRRVLGPGADSVKR